MSYKIRPDWWINLKVQANILRQTDDEKSLLTSGANNRGTEILHFFLEFSLSFQRSVIADTCSWRALSYWLHSKKKCSGSSILWPQLHNCRVLADSLYGFREIPNSNYVLSQRWPRNARYRWVPWNFSGLPDYAHGYYSQHISWAFVPIDPMNIPTKFEVRSFTSFWDNRGNGNTKIVQFLDTPTLHYLQNF